MSTKSSAELIAERTRKHGEALALIDVIAARLRHPEYLHAAKQAGQLQRLLVNLAALEDATRATLRDEEHALIAAHLRGEN